MPDARDDLALFARSGNESAFRRVVDCYGSFVLHAARRRVGEDGLAEEVAQGVFCRLAQKAATVSKYQSVAAWLHETTKREAAHCLRSQVRHRRRVESYQSEPQATMTSDDHARELRELRPFLEEAVDSLKSAERAILFARLFDERGFREIAGELGKSESACKMSLSRSLEKLRKFLNARGITYSAVALASLLQAEWARAAPFANLEVLATHSLAKSGSGLFISIITVMTHSKTLLIAGIALLFVAGYQIVKKGPIQERQTSSAHRSSQGPASNPQVSHREGRPRSPRKSSEEKPETTHEAKDLGQFYIPTMVFENTTLSDVMDSILVRYREICRETGETPLSLEWKIEGANEVIDRFVFEGELLSGSFALGLITKKICQFDGSYFVFMEIPDGPSIVQS